tara:strand:+ start:3721 stop:3990 length:270 start_codon:yes stop_codon:yes gene_type:complete
MFSPPRLDLGPSVGQRQLPAAVHALVAQAAIKALDEAFSVCLPGRENLNVTPFSKAQRSSAFEMNSGPLSTRMVFGAPGTEGKRCVTTP